MSTVSHNLRVPSHGNLRSNSCSYLQPEAHLLRPSGCTSPPSEAQCFCSHSAAAHLPLAEAVLSRHPDGHSRLLSSRQWFHRHLCCRPSHVPRQERRIAPRRRQLARNTEGHPVDRPHTASPGLQRAHRQERWLQERWVLCTCMQVRVLLPQLHRRISCHTPRTQRPLLLRRRPPC